MRHPRLEALTTPSQMWRRLLQQNHDRWSLYYLPVAAKMSFRKSPRAETRRFTEEAKCPRKRQSPGEAVVQAQRMKMPPHKVHKVQGGGAVLQTRSLHTFGQADTAALPQPSRLLVLEVQQPQIPTPNSPLFRHSRRIGRRSIVNLAKVRRRLICLELYYNYHVCSICILSLIVLLSK